MIESPSSLQRNAGWQTDVYMTLAAFSAGRQRLFGNETVNVVPFPSSLSTVIVP